MYSKRFIALYMFCFSCFVLSGCYNQTARGTEDLLDSWSTIEERSKQRDIEYYAPIIYEAKKYVEESSTEEMKEIISRGKLIIGMNQLEVMASLDATNFQYGVPIRMNKYTSAYGKLETWKIGGRSESKYTSYSSPKYMLTFTNNILTDIYEP